MFDSGNPFAEVQSGTAKTQPHSSIISVKLARNCFAYKQEYCRAAGNYSAPLEANSYCNFISAGLAYTSAMQIASVYWQVLSRKNWGQVYGNGLTERNPDHSDKSSLHGNVEPMSTLYTRVFDGTNILNTGMKAALYKDCYSTRTHNLCSTGNTPEAKKALHSYGMVNPKLFGDSQKTCAERYCENVALKVKALCFLSAKLQSHLVTIASQYGKNKCSSNIPDTVSYTRSHYSQLGEYALKALNGICKKINFRASADNNFTHDKNNKEEKQLLALYRLLLLWMQTIVQTLYHPQHRV